MNKRDAGIILQGGVEKIEWINRGGLWSLSIYPILNWDGSFANNREKEEIFEAIKVLHQDDWQWQRKNVKTMEAQFNCHYYKARQFKTPWNLEPHRTEMNWLCN